MSIRSARCGTYEGTRHGEAESEYGGVRSIGDVRIACVRGALCALACGAGGAAGPWAGLARFAVGGLVHGGARAGDRSASASRRGVVFSSPPFPRGGAGGARRSAARSRASSKAGDAPLSDEDLAG